MHKLHECVTKEINDIVEHGISTSNLKILGELVDIRKDIEEMWHWRVESGDIEVSGHHSSHGVSTSIDDLMADVKYLNEKMKTTDSVDLTNKFKDDIKKLMMYAEKIKSITEEVKIDSETMTKFKNLFRY